MALGIAHLLNYRLRGRTFFRVAILMPYATSLAAATVIFAELFDPNLGLINWGLHALHLPTVDWQGSKWPSPDRGLDDRHLALDRLQRADLPGRHAGDRRPTLYEAAAIDGASRWQQFRHVTLPGLRPTILFTIVVSTIGAAQLFGEPLLYDPTACPTAARQNQYQTLGLLMYQQGWTNDRLGLASATAWTMFLIIVARGRRQPAAGARRERREVPARARSAAPWLAGAPEVTAAMSRQQLSPRALGAPTP